MKILMDKENVFGYYDVDKDTLNLLDNIKEMDLNDNVVLDNTEHKITRIDLRYIEKLIKILKKVEKGKHADMRVNLIVKDDYPVRIEHKKIKMIIAPCTRND